MKTAVIYNAGTGRIEVSAAFDDPLSREGEVSKAEAFCQANAAGRPWLVYSGALSADQHKVHNLGVVAQAHTQLAEQEWTKVRYRRFQLLADSDWRVTRAAETGVPMSAAWLAYRQALRDVTNQTDPFAIVWPTPPA